MCYANFTQHSGCGHIGPSTKEPLTLCDAAIQRLYALRGPNSPPISPLASAQPSAGFFSAPPKRSASRRRFLSLSQTLSRSSSAATRSSAGAVSRAQSVKSAAPSFSPSTTVAVEIDYAALPAHQVGAVKCGETVRRSKVAGEMDVCEGCRGAMRDMRRMLERYDKTHSIRGTAAFETFLRHPPSSSPSPASAPAPGDLTIPLRDSITDAHTGAMQAIVLGHAADTTPPHRGGTWGRDADAETLSDHAHEVGGPQRAVIVGRGIEGHPSEAGWLVEGGTNGLGYWKGDDVSSLATSRVFAGI